MREGLLTQCAWGQHLLQVVLGNDVIGKPVARVPGDALLYALPQLILRILDNSKLCAGSCRYWSCTGM